MKERLSQRDVGHVEPFNIRLPSGNHCVNWQPAAEISQVNMAGRTEFAAIRSRRLINLHSHAGVISCRARIHGGAVSRWLLDYLHTDSQRERPSRRAVAF